MTTFYTHCGSPLGPILLTSDGTSLTGLFIPPHRHAPSIGADWEHRDHTPPFSEVARQLAEYFAGARTAFDLPLAPTGTPFQTQVWAELARIPYGQTLSYSGLAARIGNPQASRAVGLANGRNPISIIIPCHRVIGANGQLTGYGGGVSRKQALLALEAGSARENSLWEAPAVAARGQEFAAG